MDAAGKGPSSCCVVGTSSAAVAVVGTSFVVAVVDTSFAAVDTSFDAAAVAEPLVPFAHWVEVLCCWTLQMDHADCNDRMGFVWPFPHIHNLHFGVEVVSWHFHLHTDCLVVACQTLQPEKE